MKLFSPAKHGGLEDPGNKLYKAQKTTETKVTRPLPRVLQGMWYYYQGMDRLNSWQIEGVSRMQSSRVLFLYPRRLFSDAAASDSQCSFNTSPILIGNPNKPLWLVLGGMVSLLVVPYLGWIDSHRGWEVPVHADKHRKAGTVKHPCSSQRKAMLTHLPPWTLGKDVVYNLVIFAIL